MDIPDSTVVGLLGPNGPGKTSLISILAGLARPTSGRITWDGEVLASPFGRHVRRRIGMVTQETALADELTVRQNLLYAADPSRAGRSPLAAGVRSGRCQPYRRTTSLLRW